MVINNFTVQLASALPGLEKIDTPKGRTLRGEISTDFGRLYAYIKILSIEDIAKEAICAVLARKLHMPVPQPFYVGADPINTGHIVGNVHHIAFALQEEQLPMLRIRDLGSIQKEILHWPELYSCAVFDAWIANRDRLPHNLLYEGNNSFWMIDHEEALPGFVASNTSVGTQLIEIIKTNKSEHELYQIREKLLLLAEQYEGIDWDDIKRLVRFSDLPGSEKYFDSYISRLRERSSNIKQILTQELEIKQLSMNFKISKKNSTDDKGNQRK